MGHLKVHQSNSITLRYFKCTKFPYFQKINRFDILNRFGELISFKQQSDQEIEI